MEDEKRRLINRNKVKKHRAIRKEVEEIMTKRSRYHLRTGNKLIYFFAMSAICFIIIAVSIIFYIEFLKTFHNRCRNCHLFNAK